MTIDYRIISADSHVNPPPTFWRDYLPERFKDAAPRLEQTDEGDFLLFEGHRTPVNLLPALAGKEAEDYRTTGKLSEARPGGWEPQARLEDLALGSAPTAVGPTSADLTQWRPGMTQLSANQARW